MIINQIKIFHREFQWYCWVFDKDEAINGKKRNDKSFDVCHQSETQIDCEWKIFSF